MNGKMKTLTLSVDQLRIIWVILKYFQGTKMKNDPSFRLMVTYWEIPYCFPVDYQDMSDLLDQIEATAKEGMSC